MKLPRDIDGRRLAVTLRRLGYQVVRQRGSHLQLVTDRYGEHHVVIPDHHPLKVGTLNSVLNSVMEHHGLSREELIELLEL